MTERKQINWITGLKGIACIGVMLMHFRAAFMMDGTTNAYQLSKGVHFLFEKIFSVWLNGNFMVCLFCVISGYLLSKSKISSWWSLMVKIMTRYLRLALPLFGGCALVYGLYCIGAFHNDTAGRLMENDWFSGFYQKLEAKNILLSPFYKIVMHGEDSFGMPFWMMGSLLKGSCLSLAFVYAKRGQDYKIIRIIVCLGAVVYLLHAVKAGSYIMPAFFLGTGTGFMEDKVREKLPNICGWICFLLPLFMCAGLQDHLCVLVEAPEWAYASGMWRTIWSVVLFVGILCLKPVQNVLSKKICLILGRISFEIYILHWPLICSLSAIGFLFFYTKMNTDLLVLLLLAVTVLITILVSELFSRYYERYCMILVKWIERKLGV